MITLGCSKNTVDTQHILSQVEKDYEVVPEGEDEEEGNGMKTRRSRV